MRPSALHVEARMPGYPDSEIPTNRPVGRHRPHARGCVFAACWFGTGLGNSWAILSGQFL